MAKRLAQDWKCEIVSGKSTQSVIIEQNLNVSKISTYKHYVSSLSFSAYDTIMENIECHTEMGAKAVEILLRGEAVSEEMAAKMVEDKINSPEVAHHGKKYPRFRSSISSFK